MYLTEQSKLIVLQGEINILNTNNNNNNETGNARGTMSAREFVEVQNNRADSKSAGIVIDGFGQMHTTDNVSETEDGQVSLRRRRAWY